MIFTIALYNHNISCLFSSSCKCHTLDIQLAPWIFSWHSHTMFQQQLSGGCWHWKRTTSAALEPGNDCGKLRHPPLPEQSTPSPVTPQPTCHRTPSPSLQSPPTQLTSSTHHPSYPFPDRKSDKRQKARCSLRKTGR